MAGGALGACARFWLSGFVSQRAGGGFPWGTLAVNVTGAFAIGVLSALMLTPAGVRDAALLPWLLLVAGGLGSYTTVSSFSLQTLALLRLGERGRAWGNLVASMGLCLAAVLAGQAVETLLP